MAWRCEGIMEILVEAQTTPVNAAVESRFTLREQFK
jgi:hypothetical protein